jgi:hypothetical protein
MTRKIGRANVAAATMEKWAPDVYRIAEKSGPARQPKGHLVVKGGSLA